MMQQQPTSPAKIRPMVYSLLSIPMMIWGLQTAVLAGSASVVHANSATPTAAATTAAAAAVRAEAPVATSATTGTTAAPSTTTTTSSVQSTATEEAKKNANAEVTAPQKEQEPQKSAEVTPAGVLEVANHAVLGIYNYSHKTYEEALQKASMFFSAKGWKSFHKALDESNNIKVIQERQLIVSAKAAGEPKLVTSRMIANQQQWIVQMPILVTYENPAKQVITQNLMATVLVVKDEKTSNYLVEQVVMNLITASQLPQRKTV